MHAQLTPHPLSARHLSSLPSQQPSQRRLTGPHLSNLTLVQDHATNELYIKGAQTKHTAGSLTHNLRQQQQQQQQQQSVCEQAVCSAELLGLCVSMRASQHT
jgi:hypothetical protein